MSESFTISRSALPPRYLDLELAEIRRRANEAVASLAQCRVCPRRCDVNRLENKTASCRVGRRAIVSSHFPHLGEEDCLRGTKGSGTIFFGFCNLRCVFCQNHDISQARAGQEISPQEMARMMLSLQSRGCHNINFVTPEHVVPQILEALPIAIEGGLRLPIVYNTSAYDDLQSLAWMDGLVDIYLPDFKFWDDDLAKRYLKAADYRKAACDALREMHCQVGDLVFDERGLARRGLLVRHLVMPEEVCGTNEIMHFLSEELSPHTYVNIMDQYMPDAKVYNDSYSEINRPITNYEYKRAFQDAEVAGLYRFDRRRSFRSRRLF